MPWRTAHRFRGGKPRKKAQVFLQGEDPKVAARKRAISQKQRPLYYMKEGEVRKGVLQGGEVVEGEPVASKVGNEKLGYTTAQQKCPELTPSKAVQRTELAEKIDGGTVLELFAGKGNLSDKVYSKEADKIVLVEKQPALLKKADEKLNGKVKHEAVCADNLDWLRNELTQDQIRKLRPSLVDFDPFGSPAATMKEFFKQVPIRKKTFIAVTDGSKMYLGYKKGAAAHSWLRKNYGIDLNAQGTREDQIRVLDAFMQTLGRHYNFKVRPVNAGFGKHNAVYAGYEIVPN